jgi:hypothetical protein
MQLHCSSIANAIEEPLPYEGSERRNSELDWPTRQFLQLRRDSLKSEQAANAYARDQRSFSQPHILYINTHRMSDVDSNYDSPRDRSPDEHDEHNHTIFS